MENKGGVQVTHTVITQLQDNTTIDPGLHVSPLPEPEPLLFQEQERHPGIQAIEPSNLEVVHTRTDLSRNRTFEQPSLLPEPASHPLPHFPEPPHAVQISNLEPITPQSLISSNAPFPTPSLILPPLNGGKLPPLQSAHQQPPNKKPTILNLPRRTFFLLLALTILLLTTALSVGLGLGVSHLKQKQSQSQSTGDDTTTPNSHARFPAPTTSASLDDATTRDIQCPRDNLTLYTSSTSTNKASERKFIFFCGRDYPWQKGSVELYNRPTKTMGECIDLCADDGQCVAVGWGAAWKLCYLKSHVANSEWVSGWLFAVVNDLPR